ncbi:MAG: zinc ribbon domain-containing protein [Ruminococcaceae bacterium]|nr:zinc ribbon domain-containing protein [Oscillospiraceae bacterium]
MYCIKCGVQLSDGQKICPICETRVYHPDIEIPDDMHTYPKKDFKSEAFNRKGLMFAITILFAIAAILPTILELSWHERVHWSGYVAGGVILAYLIYVLPYWFKNPNPAIFVPCDFAGVGLLLLYISLETGGKWFLPFAMPIVIAFGAVISAMAILRHYLKRGRLYIYGGGIIALGICCVLIEILLRSTFGVNTSFYWSIAPLTVLFIIGMALIVIEIVKPFKESLRRIFFI